MEKATPDKVLKDPDFYQLPEFERIKVLDKIDPDFKNLPEGEKLKVVTAFAGKSKDELRSLFVKEAPIYEKAWRQFAHGSGQLVETVGELVNKVSKVITPDPLMQYQGQRIAEGIKQIGKETKDYWKADEYQNKFHGLGGEIVNALIRETPSLIAFSPVMKTTGSLAMSALSPKSRVAKSVVESLGTGAGYTAVNLAGRENYDLKDAGVDTAIDLTFGAASPHVAKGIKIISKKVDPFFEKIASELRSLFKIAKKTKHREATIKIAEAYRSAKEGERLKVLEMTDELLNRDDIPVPVKRKAAEIQTKIKEDLPEPVKEAGAESTDAYVDLKLDDYKKVASQTATEINPKVFTKEEWNKEFSQPIKTPIGTVKMGDFQYKKMLDKRKRDLFPAIKPTLEDPLLIIKDRDGVVFIKPFILKTNGKKHIEFISVTKRFDTEDVVVSNHKIGDSKLEKLLKRQVLYKNAAAFCKV